MNLFDQMKNILDSARTTFTTPGEEILGIDIGSSSVKLVELHRKGGRIELFTYGDIALGPYDEKPVGAIARLDTDTLSTAIKYLLTASSAQTRDAILGVPATQSLVFLVTLPNVARSNLAAIIPSEARKYIPVALSEVVLDWLPLPFPITDDKETFQVLVAATRAKALAALKEVAEKSGLVVHGYELEIFAQIRSLLASEISSVLLVDVGALKTRVSIVRQGVVYNSRMLNFSSHNVTESIMRVLAVDFDHAEDAKKKYGIAGGDIKIQQTVDPLVLQLVSEIKAILHEYETTYSTIVEKIMLLGGGIQMLGMFELIQKQMQPVICSRSNAFHSVLKPRFLEPVVANIDPLFATALGLAERHFDV